MFIILTGLQTGSSLTGFGKGFRFIVSTAAMIVLLLPDVRAAVRQDGEPRRATASHGGAIQSTFRTLALLAIVLWSLYPVVWLLGTEGFNAVGSTLEVFLFLIFDFFA